MSSIWKGLSLTRRRALGAALTLPVAVAVVVVLVLSSGSPSPSGSSAGRSGSGATTVERRDLVQTDTESGTLSYSDPQTVYDRLSGTVTWLPSVGQTIKPGQALFDVDGAPVSLMNGSTPAYRDLSPADSAGADVGELNRNLIALDFNPEGITPDDTWQAATTAGVDVFQESLGESPTGTLTLGQIVFLPGDQLVATMDGALGSTGGSGGSSAASTSAALDPPRPQFVSLHTGATPTTAAHRGAKHRAPHRQTSSGAQTIAALIALLRAQSAQLQADGAELRTAKASTGHPSSSPSAASHGSPPPAASSSGGSSGSDAGAGGSSAGSGAGAASGQAILQTTSTQLVVTVDLAASVQSEAVVGERVTVEMPSGNTVDGQITAVSPVAQNASNPNAGGSGGGSNDGGGSGGGSGAGSSGSSSTVPVTIKLSGPQTGAGLDQATVSVNFIEQRAANVLSVPVTALLAQAGGTYAVQEADAPYQLVPVTTGLFAAGDVQISGPGIYSGLRVTDSQG